MLTHCISVYTRRYIHFGYIVMGETRGSRYISLGLAEGAFVIQTEGFADSNPHIHIIQYILNTQVCFPTLSFLRAVIADN